MIHWFCFLFLSFNPASGSRRGTSPISTRVEVYSIKHEKVKRKCNREGEKNIHMWTATLDYSSRRVLLMRLLSRFCPGVCFTSWSPLRVQNLPRPSLPANNWVRVRNRLAGVSGNDLQLIRGEGDPQIAPAALGSRYQTYPGHEVVGEVIEVGENVQHLRVGDRVILQN